MVFFKICFHNNIDCTYEILKIIMTNPEIDDLFFTEPKYIYIYIYIYVNR